MTTQTRQPAGGSARPVVLLLLAALLLVLPILPGCAASQQKMEANRAVTDYFVGDYGGAIQRLRPLADTTDQDFVLNNVRLGSAALVNYDLEQAEVAFLRAYEVMNSVGVNDGGRSLGAVLVDEGSFKVWKGEPFERAMANFYLGLIYYMKKDYGNARAAFENSLFKLRDYADDADEKEGNYREAENNFALGYLMLGKTYQRLGEEDKARDALGRAVQIREYLAPVADFERNDASNLLLVVEFGQGPKKMAEFDGSVSAFGPSPRQVGPVPPPRVVVDGRVVDLEGADAPPVDLLALAQDRRWQSIDTIRAVKSAVGTGLIAGGLYEGTRRRGDSGVAAGLILAGLALKATSQADVRQWEMLPRTVYVIPLRVEPGRHDITVDFPDVPGLRQTWRDLVVPARGEATYYFRMQRYNTGPFDWPPPALADAGVDEPVNR